jgi:PhnB protein
LLGNDAFPGAYERPQGFTATLGGSGIARAKEIFDALSESGRVQMQFQETFWSAGYGQLVDRFGVPWEVNCEQPPASR